MLLVLVSVFNAFAQTFEQGGIFYEVTDAENKLLTLLWGGDCKGDVVLPESVTYNGVEYTIDNIEDRAFLECMGLTSIVIPEGVTRIGTQAFNNCTNLKSVSFPKSIAEIYTLFGCFRGCDKLTSINNYTTITFDCFHGLQWYDEKYNEWYNSLPDGIIREGNVVLGYKGTMPDNTSLVIPDGVTHITQYAFSGCNELRSITIPASITYIGEKAFRGCENLESINILGNPKTIGSDAFYKTAWYDRLPDGLVSIGNSVIDYKGYTPDTIIIPDGITYIADWALSNKECSAITIPPSVERCGLASFAHNYKLTSVTLSEGLKSIGMCAFESCNSLKSIRIPQSVVNIGNGAFQYSKKLESVYLPDGLTNIRDDIFSLCDSLKSIVIPDGVVIIGEDAFEKCHKLQSVNIPDKVRRIGQRAFYECYSLASSIVIPEGVKEIANNTFFACGALTSVSIPDGLITIGAKAFYYCSGIEELVIPESLDSIGPNALYGCSAGLKSIVVASGNSRYDSRNNCNALIEKETNTLILGCNNTVIPDNILNIGSGAFVGCEGITSLTIPKGVVSIENEAFANCINLTLLTIPENVKRIGYNSFKNCKINTINWYSELSPVNVLGCCGGSLKRITFGGNVKKIQDGLFCYYVNCNALTSISLLEGVSEIGERAFATLSNLTSINIPSSVSKIGDYAFDWCKKLTDVTISNGVDSIGNGAFMDCEALNVVTIPKSVSYIGNRAFENCDCLDQVIICGTPEIGVNAFLSPNITKVTSKSYTPGGMNFKNPFVGGEPEDVIVYGDRTNVYDSTLCRTITKSEFSNNYIRNSCFVNMNNIPAGRYRVSLGILPSPDTIPNVLHPVITGITDNGYFVLFDSVSLEKDPRGRPIETPYIISNQDKYKTDTIVTTVNNNGTDFEEVSYKYTYVSGGYDTLTIVDDFFIPDSVKSLNIELLSKNEAGYLLFDRVFFEPLNELPSQESYSGPFTENVFNNAILYVPEESVDAYRIADGWKWFKNIAIDTAVDPIRRDNRNYTGSQVIYDMLGRKVTADSIEGLQPGLYIINGKKYLKR